METYLKDIIDLKHFALAETDFRSDCRDIFEDSGYLILKNFLKPQAVKLICKEALLNQYLAYYCIQEHNVYLTTKDTDYEDNHPRNRNLKSSKGCITDDQVPIESLLRTLYDSLQFRKFLCSVLGEDALYEYTDSLSSINIHYASKGQELAWHFDNSSFAITLLLQQADKGGDFQYLRNMRYTSNGDPDFESTRQVLDGKREPQNLIMESGSLVLFRGQESIHRVVPVKGEKTRISAVLAYNSKPGIKLSEEARMTFFGRLGNEKQPTLFGAP